MRLAGGGEESGLRVRADAVERLDLSRDELRELEWLVKFLPVKDRGFKST